MSYKYCVVPKCKSTSSSTPDKLFFHVPTDKKARKKWCSVMKRDPLSSKSTHYCCEDHFDANMDILTLAITHAIFYAGISQNYTETPTVNWTELSPTRWWGPAEEQASQDTAIYSANITFKEEMITDLKERLNNHMEFVPGLEGAASTYGFNSSITYTWIDRWLNQYNFTARETYLNQYPMYKTNIQGMDIFFIRVTPEVPEGKERIPLLLLHGFPSSIREFYDIIPKLTAVSDDRDFVIDLIVPSLPGFGFSEGAVRPGMGAAHIGVVLRNLMHRIGYKKFYTQGGDFGSNILKHMATIFPDEVLGFHTNWLGLHTPVAIFLQMVGQLYPPLVLSNLTLYNRMYPLSTKFTTLMAGVGYVHLQATKPDTLGIALTDSPSGLLTWILEKYITANTPSNIYLDDGGLDNDYDMTYLLDTLTIYWSTKSIQTSMRLYSETFNINYFGMRLEKIPTSVPVWVIQAAYEVTYQSPIILGLKYKNILNADVWDEGGHFLSLQFPDRLCQSILDGLTGFRKWHAANGTDTTTVA